MDDEIGSNGPSDAPDATVTGPARELPGVLVPGKALFNPDGTVNDDVANALADTLNEARKGPRHHPDR